jgi:tripartite-type tricarboxylate transporter receptor subunit TctC
MMIKLRPIAVAAGLAAATSAFTANAQDAAWPNQPVRFVVAFAPGGPTDIVARVVGDKLQQKWGQNVIVENRGGAGGSIAARQVAKAEPNGNTVLIITTSYAVNPSLSPTAGYTPEVELRTSVIAATGPNLIVGAPNLKANTLKEVMELAKTEKLSFGSAGTGTTPHLSGERIFREFGKVDVVHAPFTGSGPTMNAILGGHVPLASVSIAGMTQHVTSGAVKGLAVTSVKRLASLPNVPTAIETGYGDGEESTWVAFILPAATPNAILDKLNADVNALLKEPEMVAKMDSVGLFPVGGTRVENVAYVNKETSKWSGVIKGMGLKTE